MIAADFAASLFHLPSNSAYFERIATSVLSNPENSAGNPDMSSREVFVVVGTGDATATLFVTTEV